MYINFNNKEFIIQLHRRLATFRFLSPNLSILDRWLPPAYPVSKVVFIYKYCGFAQDTPLLSTLLYFRARLTGRSMKQIALLPLSAFD